MQTRCHLAVLIHEQAKKYGSKPALNFRKFGSLEWQAVSWNKFSLRVKQVSNAMLNLGVKVQENIGVFSQNCIHDLYTDFGAFGIRAVTVPMYATSSEQQVQYIVNDAQIRFLFVGEQEQYDKAHRVLAQCPTLERIIIFDSSVIISSYDTNSIYFENFIELGEKLPRQPEVDNLLEQAREDDLCSILYTSGTTGDSKGVMLSYRQFHAAFEGNGRCVPVSDKDRVINFLPFTHVFERAWAFLSLSVGAQLIINTYPHEIQQSMRETNPTCMASVPRFWEKVFAAVKTKIEKANPMQRKVFNHALAVGRRYNIEYLSRGKRPPLALALEYQMLNHTILSKVRKQLGLVKPNIFPTAGATVSPEVEEFVHSIGIDMLVGYGLTESLATVSCDHRGKKYTVGSVGRLLDNIEVKIGENDEILLKGDTITKGYYKREALNAEAFDSEGYFRTGDAGYMLNGELFLKERIKDLFKTSNGKYIAPQMIEAKLVVDKFIDQIAIVADLRKYVSALIVPDFNELEEFAREYGIEFESREDLCNNKKIYRMMMERINTLQQSLANYEKIKCFTLLPNNFSIENEELTNTLKLKRRVIEKKYSKEIDKMYEE